MNDFIEIIKWLETEAKTIEFGSCGIVLSLHAGKIVRIEKSTTVKINNGIGSNNDAKNIG